MDKLCSRAAFCPPELPKQRLPARLPTRVGRVCCPCRLASCLDHICRVNAEPGDSAAQAAGRPERRQAVAAGGSATRLKPFPAACRTQVILSRNCHERLGDRCSMQQLRRCECSTCLTQERCVPQALVVIQLIPHWARAARLAHRQASYTQK